MPPGPVTSIVWSRSCIPDAVSRSDGGSALPAATRLVRGAEAIARSAIMFARPSAVVRRALVNGAAGVIVSDDGRLVTIIGFNGLRWTDRRD